MNRALLVLIMGLLLSFSAQAYLINPGWASGVGSLNWSALYQNMSDAADSSGNVTRLVGQNLTTPWFSSSTACAVANLQSGSNCNIGTVNFSQYCEVTDEHSVKVLTLAMGTSQTKMNQAYNSLFAMKANYGNLPGWRCLVNETATTISCNDSRTNSNGDAASDANARYIQAFVIAANNTNFNSTARTNYGALAVTLAADSVAYELETTCRNSSLGYGQICYWLASGPAAKSGGLGSGSFTYSGYFGDYVLAMLYVYKLTGNATYLNVARNVTLNYFQAAYPNGTSLASNGFRVSPGRAFHWANTSTIPWPVCDQVCAPDYWDESDAVRAFYLCQADYTTNITNISMPAILHDYCTNWTGTYMNQYNSLPIQYYSNGTPAAANLSSFWAQGLQADALLSLQNVSKVNASMTSCAGHYNEAIGKWDYTACTGLYQEQACQRVIGISIGLSDAALGLNTSSSNPVMVSSRIAPTTAYYNDTLTGYCNATGSFSSYNFQFWLNGGLNYSGSFYNWTSNSSIISGLGDIGAYAAPTVFILNGVRRLISGSSWNPSQTFGFDWNGSSWVSNSSVVAGFSIPTFYSTPTVFNLSGTLTLISGEIYGGFYGFQWNGTSWVSNSSVVSGLNTYSSYSVSTVFDWAGTWTIFTGNSYVYVYGYQWNGTNWVANASITTGIVDTLYNSAPAVFNNSGTLTLIIGGHDGSFNKRFDGYVWSGSSWVSLPAIVGGLTPVSSYDVPVVFNSSGMWLLISGYNAGGFVGYQFSSLSGEVNIGSQSSLMAGQNWTLSCQANDLTGVSSWLNSSVLTISNYVPLNTWAAQNFSFSHSTSYVGGNYCSDPEGLTLTYASNHSLFPMLSNGSFNFSGTGAVNSTSYAVAVTCNDSVNWTTATTNITLTNAAPNVTAVTLATLPLQLGQNVTCNYTGEDADNDSVSGVTYDWWKNGVNLSIDNATLSSGNFTTGDNITCSVRVNDSLAWSNWTNSTPATIGDTVAPTITNFTLAPDSITTAETTTISVVCTDANTIAWAKAQVTDPNTVATNYTMTDAGSTYTKVFTPSLVGTHSIKVFCQDGNGNLANTSSLSLTVRAVSGSGGAGSTTEEEAYGFEILEPANAQKTASSFCPPGGVASSQEFVVYNTIGQNREFQFFTDGEACLMNPTSALAEGNTKVSFKLENCTCPVITKEVKVTVMQGDKTEAIFVTLVPSKLAAIIANPLVILLFSTLLILFIAGFFLVVNLLVRRRQTA